MSGMSTFLAYVRIEISTIKYEFSIMRSSYSYNHSALCRSVLYSNPIHSPTLEVEGQSCLILPFINVHFLC